MSAVTRIKFYYDPVSPWAYLTSIVLKRYEKLWNLSVEYCPMFLGAIMVASGNRPPATIPNKGKYQGQQDLPKVTAYFGVPIKTRAGFPPQTLYISRFLKAVKDLEGHDTLVRVTQRFFHAEFNHRVPDVFAPPGYRSIVFGLPTISKPKDPENKKSQEFVEEPNPLAGQQPVMSKEGFERCWKAMGEEKYKKIIKEEAEALVKRGAFGFPWMEITHPETGEVTSFFGFDRFEIIAWWLGKEWKGPFPEGRLAGSTSKL